MLLKLIEQIGAQPPDHAGGAGGSDDHDRDPQMSHQRMHLPPGPGLIEVNRIHQAADGDAEPDMGEIEQDQGQKEAGGGQAQETKQADEIIGQAGLMGRRIYGDRKAHHPDEQDRGQRQHHGQQQSVAHHLGDGQVVFEAVTEIAV